MKKIFGSDKNFLDQRIRFSEHSIESDKLDFLFFKDIKDKNPRLKELVEEVGENYKPFPQLQEDIFSSLFRYKPVKVKENRIKSSHYLNWLVMDQIMDLPKYKELRAMTMHDDVNSTVGTEILSDKAYRFVKEKQEELGEELKEYQNAESEAKKAAKEFESEQSHDTKDKDEKSLKSDISPKKFTLKQAQQRLEAARNSLKSSMKKKKVQNQLNSLLSETTDNVKETSDLIQNWGLSGNDKYMHMPYEQKMELLKRLRENKKLKQIAELAGRFKRLATQKQKEKVKKGMDELYNIRVGNDLSRLIPQEYIRLRNPLTKKMFQKDWIEGKLLQYEIKGKEKKHKGPIVCCIDNSGSMAGAPETWSKAVALALLEVALYQKRSFYCIHFSSETNINLLHTNEFPRGAGRDLEEIIDMAEYFESGGTLFEPPLNKARELINTEENYRKADIIFITDGESAVSGSWSEDFIKWKKENNIKIYSVLIDQSYNSGSTLEIFSDSINKLSTMSVKENEELAITLFDSM